MKAGKVALWAIVLASLASCGDGRHHGDKGRWTVCYAEHVPHASQQEYSDFVVTLVGSIAPNVTHLGDDDQDLEDVVVEAREVAFRLYARASPGVRFSSDRGWKWVPYEELSAEWQAVVDHVVTTNAHAALELHGDPE